MIYPIGGVFGALLAAAAGGESFTWAAAGAIVATVVSAGIQAWRGRSQSKVEDATVLKLKQEAGKLLDERWQKIAERLDVEKQELLEKVTGLEGEVKHLEEEISSCHSEISSLRVQLGAERRTKRR